jgi:hypothetical protein
MKYRRLTYVYHSRVVFERPRSDTQSFSLVDTLRKMNGDNWVLYRNKQLLKP